MLFSQEGRGKAPLSRAWTTDSLTSDSGGLKAKIRVSGWGVGGELLVKAGSGGLLASLVCEASPHPCLHLYSVHQCLNCPFL